MNQLIIILLFSLVLGKTYSQNDTIIPNLYGHYCVQTMTQSGQQFVYNFEEFEFINNYPDTDTLSVVYEADTIATLAIAGDKVYIKRTGVPFNPVYVGFKPQFGNGYEILYDFGLNLGDTAYFQYSEVTVDSIDYVNVQGEQRRRLILSNNEYWVAGLGSTVHPLTAMMFYFEVGYQLCSSEMEYFGGSAVDYDTYSAGSCLCNVGLEEEAKEFNKQLVKITDLMGRETKYKPNTTLIYVYSDGTTEKIYRME